MHRRGEQRDGFRLSVTGIAGIVRFRLNFWDMVVENERDWLSVGRLSANPKFGFWYYRFRAGPRTRFELSIYKAST